MDDRAYLLILPLLILFTISMISMTGLNGTTTQTLPTNQTISVGSGKPSEVIYYAIDGDPKMYANGTIIHEKGDIVAYGDAGDNRQYACWSNASSKALFGHPYQLDWFADKHTTDTFIYYDEIGQTSGTNSENGGIAPFDMSTTLGIIALVVAISAVVAIIGFRFIDIGLSETGVHTIQLTTFFVALWGVFSVLSLPLLTGESIGAIAYFFITLIYSVGIILNVKA